jgi:2-polyprenyl-6-methoxyphenol hydroxylase-like FAD-dependent oxidoreductase
MNYLRQVPVLIIGGGPVGLGLAADLGWRGIECLLVERSDGSVFHPRANTVNSRTMEFCRRWGGAEAVREAGAPPEYSQDILYVTSLQGRTIAHIERPAYGGAKPLPTTPEPSQRCNQLFFDPVIRSLASGFETVTLEYETQFESFEPADNGGVVATVKNLETGGTEQIEARYLVACCGGNSPVPGAIGSVMEGVQLLSYNLNCFVKIPELWKYHDKPNVAFYFMTGDATGANSFIELDGKELWRMGLVSTTGPLSADTVDVHAILKKLIGEDVPYELLSTLPWTCRSIVADKWSDGPVFLAGDAVHQNSPAGGFGMNTGMGDAVDLGWKLAAMIDGWGGAALGESYGLERRPVAQRNVAQATGNREEDYCAYSGELLDADTLEAEQLRQRLGAKIVSEKTSQFVSHGIALGYRYDTSPIVAGDGTRAPPLTVGDYVPTTYPGARAPHAWIDANTSTIDIFGKGFVLMNFTGEAEAAGPFLGVADRCGMPLRVVNSDDADLAALYERKLVLVRPDGHVAWRGDAPPDDAAGIIDQVRGAA